MILAAIFTSVTAIAITQFTKRWNMKPLNCEMCMTFWLSLFVSIGTFSYLVEMFEFIGIAIFTRQLIYRVWPTMF